MLHIGDKIDLTYWQHANNAELSGIRFHHNSRRGNAVWNVCYTDDLGYDYMGVGRACIYDLLVIVSPDGIIVDIEFLMDDEYDY